MEKPFVKPQIGLKNYLAYTSSLKGNSYQTIDYLILMAWLSGVIVILSFHEVWRDEMRAYVVADIASTIFDIPKLLVNDGHPPLWHILIFFVNYFIQSTITLQILSVGISFAAIFLFYRHSPFPNYQKILFIFSIIPFYEYTIFARNYGISMLLMIIAAIILSKYRNRIIVFYAVLSLLALTNIHSIFLSTLFVFLMLFLDGKNLINKFWLKNVIGIILLFGTIIYSLKIIMPTEESLYESTLPTNVVIIKGFVRQLLIFGDGFKNIFFGHHTFLKAIMFWIILVGLIKNRITATAFILGMIGLGVFFNIGYKPYLRHEGLFFVFIIMLFWLQNAYSDKTKSQEHTYYKYINIFILTTILLLQLKYSFEAVYKEIKYDISNSKDFSEYIIKNPDYKNAIIIGEPDIHLESLPYYIENQIYFSREKRFGRRVNYTSVRDSSLTLMQLLDDANYLQEKYMGPPIFILLNHNIDSLSTYEYRSKVMGVFRWDSISRNEFKHKTNLVRKYSGSVTGEDYTVYQYKPN